MTFEQHLHRTEPKLRSTAIYMIRNAGIADELLQRTRIKAYRAYASFDPSLPFGPWINRILVNTIRDYLRREKGHLSLDALYDDSEWDCEDPKQDGDLLLSDIHALWLISWLPVTEQGPIAAKIRGDEWDAYSASQGVPTATVKGRFARGAKKLREKMKEEV